MAIKIHDLAQRLGLVVVGDGDAELSSVARLDSARRGDLSFVANPAYLPLLANTQASAVILRSIHADRCPVTALLAEDPYVAYARAAQLLYPSTPVAAYVHPSAVIGADCEIPPSVSIGPCAVLGDRVRLGEGVMVGAHCFLDANVEIGAHSELKARVTLYKGIRVGARCLVHSGAVIGADGFGFANDHGEWVKIPQIGGVVIGDDVEIGANTTIDRGAINDTTIGDGVKLDNLIQIGHNAVIGAHTAVAACTGIAGSARIGRHCAIGGCVGIAGHIDVADHAIITGMSFVSQSIPRAGSYSSGLPLQETSKWRRSFVRIRQLDELVKQVRKLEKQLSE
ncbi:MAG: UDP-3-O-(3-hydroxymyristoyl)glucosamine N-acyltransferase [Thiotrichales bacterium]